MRPTAIGLLAATALAGAVGRATADIYTDGNLTVDLVSRGDDFSGQLSLGGQSFPAAAHKSGGEIDGTFQANGNAFTFTATLNADTMTLVTDGTTYTLNAKRPAAVNPLAGGTHAAAAASAAPASDVPAGYTVVTHTDAGQSLSGTKPDAASVHDALLSTLDDLKTYFGEKPAVIGAYEDAKDHRSGGATFTATLKGRAVRGMMSAKLGDHGADVAVLYARADAPADEWKKLAAVPPAPVDPAIQNAKFTTYPFPDGTGSIGVADGWKTTSQSALDRIIVEGPNQQHIVIGASFFVITPDSPMMQTQRQMEARARQMGAPPPPMMPMLVAPFSGPSDALKALVPQLSEMNQRAGSFGLRLDEILSDKELPARSPQGKAALLEYKITKNDHGRVIPLHAIARMECTPIAQGSWSSYAVEISGPEESFEKDKTLMFAMIQSEKENNDVCQRLIAERGAAQQQQLAENGRDAAAQQQAHFDAIQKAHNEQIAGYDAHNKQWAVDENAKARSSDNFVEMIRGYRTVIDTQTGQSGSVDYFNVDGIVNGLNEGDPGRYVQVPLRDEKDPIPGQ